MFALLAALALAADWPHIRGPAFDGHSAEAGLADAWPAGGPPLVWSRDLGQGYSGFAVAGGRVYTQHQKLGGQHLQCLDAATGAILWETRYDWAWQPGGAYPGPYASPTVHEGRVYFASPSGLVGCVDGVSGDLLWSLNVRTTFKGAGTDFGYASTPLVESGRVILPVGGKGASLVALDADTGAKRWAAGDDPASYCPAFPITLGGRRRVVGFLQNSYLIADIATGALLHREELSEGYDEHSAWPLYREPDLLLPSPFKRGSSSLRLTPDDKGGITVKTRWATRQLSNDIISSVLIGRHVYGFDIQEAQASRHRASRGQFRCLEWDTGKVCWSTKEVGQASAIAADGKLILFSDAGVLHLARADPSAYRELARTQLFDGVCWTPPALSDRRLFVRGPSRMVCVHLGAPEEAPARPSEVRSWRFDPSWLLAKEREYPNDAFSRDELLLWFGVCLAILAVCWPLPRAACWPAVFVLGLFGPNLLSWLVGRCLFTWPVSVYAAFHAAVSVCERAASEGKGGWRARGAVGLFLLAGYAYFEACRQVGMFVAWAFLFGFFAAAPFALLAAWLQRKDRLWLAFACTLLGFSAYFWSGQLLLWWKTAAG